MFADTVGINRTHISDLERGTRNPTITVVENLANLLCVSASDLIV